MVSSNRNFSKSSHIVPRKEYRTLANTKLWHILSLIGILFIVIKRRVQYHFHKWGMGQLLSKYIRESISLSSLTASRCVFPLQIRVKRLCLNRVITISFYIYLCINSWTLGQSRLRQNISQGQYDAAVFYLSFSWSWFRLYVLGISTHISTTSWLLAWNDENVWKLFYATC